MVGRKGREGGAHFSVSFTGFLMHAARLVGVIPGHGVPPSGNGKDRRLTLMVGFWDTIRIQEGGPDVPPGPAMVLPPDGTHEWTKLLPLRGEGMKAVLLV